MPKLHTAASRGFQAGATTYTKGRPGYAKQACDWLTADMRLAPGQTVLEVGAGTGKFTQCLVANGAQVVAAEPVAAMRAELQSHLPAVQAIAASAEALTLADDSVDAVVCAQSFHWFANTAALGEIRRVLRPGGTFGLIWNVRDENVPWVAALTDIMRPYEGGTPRYHSGAWRRLFPAEGFSELQERRVAHGHAGTPEQVIVDRTLSTSFIAALALPEQKKVAKRIRELIADTPELAGRAAVVYPYETVAYSCTRIG